MRRFIYKIKINGIDYDITRIADSSSFSVVAPLCSTDKKSGNGTASVNIKGGANPTFYQTFMGFLLNAQQTKTLGDCLVTIKDNILNKYVHRGWLNTDEFTISSAHFPDSLNLASRDKMQLLDTKIKANRYWENTSRNQIVQDLLSELATQTGQTVTYLSTELTDSETVDYWCVAEGKEQTYREVIDTLLYEAVGYVLWYDPNSDGFRIKNIPTNYDPLNTYRTVTYRVENKLVTQSSVYEHDGILLSYPTITERPNTNIFNEGIDISIDDGGTVTGEEVLSGDYFPKDGDVKEIYQEYSVPDRAYLSGESRIQNNDLKLLYAKDVDYSLASKPQLSLAPAIPAINWNGTPQYFPDRARILFRNDNANKANVTTFSLTGTAIYISAQNKITVPSLCTNPEEYTVQSITDGAKAKLFADWFYNSKRYGCTTSKWCEPEGYSTLGEIVLVRHKDTGVEMPHVIVQITDSCAGGQSGDIRLKEVVAISLYGWQSTLSQTVPQVTKPSTMKVENAKWYSGTILTGQTTCRGVAGNYGDYYLNSDTGDIYRCIESGTENTALWQWVMNNKGESADVDSYTYVIEYGLSTSDEEFIFPDGLWGYANDNEYGYDDDEEYGFKDYEWSESIDNWVKGLYVWTRIKTTDSEGNVTYGDPTYAKDVTKALIDACIFALQPQSAEFIKNLASPNSVTDGYTVTLRFNGFSAGDAVNPLYSWTIRSNGTDPSAISAITVSGDTISFTLRRNTDATEITIEVVGIHDESILSDPDATDEQKAKAIVGCIEQSSVIMTANDITQFGVYGGVFASDADAEAYFNQECGGVYQGYSYIKCDINNPDYSDIVIRYYGVDGQWNNMLVSTNGAGEILSKCEKDFWSLYDNTTDANKEYLWNTYGYKKEIIAHAIATSKIVLYDASNGESGVIASANISTDVTQDLDAEGKYLTKDGFRLEGKNGIIRAKSGYFTDIHIAGTSEFEGEIHSNSLETHNGNTNTDTYSGNNTGNTAYWSYNDLESLLPSTSVVANLDAGSTYKGHSVTRYCHMTDLTQIYAGDTKTYNNSISLNTFRNNDRTYTYTIMGNTSGGNVVVNGRRPFYRSGSSYYYPRVELYVDGVLKSYTNKTTSNYSSLNYNFTLIAGGAVEGNVLTVVVKAWGNSQPTTSAGGDTEQITFKVQPTVTYTDNINQYGLWLYDSVDSVWILLPQTSYQNTSLSVTLSGTTVNNKYYTWENDCKRSGVTIQNGAIGSITSASLSRNGTSYSYTLVSVTWNENGITFTDINGNIVQIAKGSFFTSFSFSFQGLASDSYTMLENVLPMRDNVTEIGSPLHYFNNVHSLNLDINGKNLERFVVEFSYDTTDADDIWWYRKWSDGFIEQGGLVNGSITTGSDLAKSVSTYTFSHAFATRVLMILGKLAYPNFTGNFASNPPLTIINDVMPYNVTKTSFKPATVYDGGVYQQIDRPFYWYACGY